MFGGQEIKFAQVLTRLLEQRYKRNRAALASAAHVSPSALSQYVRGRATPSLAVLVDLAQALEVSLDYLIYGQDSSEGSESGLWAQHLDESVRRMTSEAASLRQLVDRMGINISDRIHEVAAEVVKQSGARGGALTATEVALVERYSSYTRIARVDLDAEILLPREISPDAVAAPGPFSGVIATNVSLGNDYVYIIPDSGRSIRRARLIVQEVKKAIEVHGESRTLDTAVANHLQFYVTTDGLLPGYVIYNLDRTRMAKEKPLLYDLVEGFLGMENEISGSGEDGGDVLALVAPPNPGFDVYPLISRENLPMLVKSFENLRKQSDRLSFIDQPNSFER
jgi:transcriptional regulator with XRE-family HTH domain